LDIDRVAKRVSEAVEKEIQKVKAQKRGNEQMVM